MDYFYLKNTGYNQSPHLSSKKNINSLNSSKDNQIKLSKVNIGAGKVYQKYEKEDIEKQMQSEEKTKNTHALKAYRNAYRHTPFPCKYNYINIPQATSLANILSFGNQKNLKDKKGFSNKIQAGLSNFGVSDLAEDIFSESLSDTQEKRGKKENQKEQNTNALLDQKYTQERPNINYNNKTAQVSRKSSPVISMRRSKLFLSVIMHSCSSPGSLPVSN